MNEWIDIICCSVALRYDAKVIVKTGAAERRMTPGVDIASRKQTLFVLTSSNPPGTVFPSDSQWVRSGEQSSAKTVLDLTDPVKSTQRLIGAFDSGLPESGDNKETDA